MVKEHGTCLLYLPSYSPNFNPIKLVFSTIKAWLHTNCDVINCELVCVDGSVYNALWEAVHLITTEQARGWYKHCRYIG